VRLLIVSDAWTPQVNGVVRSLTTVRDDMLARGHTVEVIGPDRFRTVPCPTYPQIPLALGVRRRLPGLMEAFDPDAVHVATEGPLGWGARAYCRRRGLTFTSSYHTMFPEYVHIRFRVPLSWTYGTLRRFHAAASATMVATPTLERMLTDRGFRNLVRWSRGVDTDLFRPRPKEFLADPRPVQMYVGRVAPEKNIEAFLALEAPGTKYVIGDGPQLDDFRRRFPDVRFPGAKFGEELASYFAAADVFVFPSRTETFGLVMLEALACGVPVAAYPVQGPVDVMNGAEVGCLDEDLGRAVQSALHVPPEACRAHALNFSWQASCEQFIGNLQPFR
jgi:glycosyltransferase involved in cell wall biosynthesis